MDVHQNMDNSPSSFALYKVISAFHPVLLPSRQNLRDTCNVFNLPFSNQMVPILDNGTTTCLEFLTLSCAATETTPGDGNCLFSALSFCLTKSFAYNFHLRQQICNNMDQVPFNNLHLLSRNGRPYSHVAEYILLERMDQNSVEGGDMEISTFCFFSGIDVMVYQSNIKCWLRYNGLRATDDVRPQVFLHHRGRHWEPITHLRVTG